MNLADQISDAVGDLLGDVVEDLAARAVEDIDIEELVLEGIDENVNNIDIADQFRSEIVKKLDERIDGMTNEELANIDNQATLRSLIETEVKGLEKRIDFVSRLSHAEIQGVYLRIEELEKSEKRRSRWKFWL